MRPASWVPPARTLCGQVGGDGTTKSGPVTLATGNRFFRLRYARAYPALSSPGRGLAAFSRKPLRGRTRRRLAPCARSGYHKKDRLSRVVRSRPSTKRRALACCTWSAKTAAMITLTSSTASVGVEGIVDLLLGDGPAGGGHEGQPSLRLRIFPQSLAQMPE